MKSTYLMVACIILIGCTKGTSHPTQLENNGLQNISINILSKNENDVPRDHFMAGKNWHYKQTIKYKYGYCFSNDEIVATFYLAHHATHIYIRGNVKKINRYKKYFLKNKVTAKIMLIPNSLRKQNNLLIIDYFSISDKIENEINVYTNSKNLLAPTSSVIEI